MNIELYRSCETIRSNPQNPPELDDFFEWIGEKQNWKPISKIRYCRRLVNELISGIKLLAPSSDRARQVLATIAYIRNYAACCLEDTDDESAEAQFTQSILEAEESQNRFVIWWSMYSFACFLKWRNRFNEAEFIYLKSISYAPSAGEIFLVIDDLANLWSNVGSNDKSSLMFQWSGLLISSMNALVRSMTALNKHNPGDVLKYAVEPSERSCWHYAISAAANHVLGRSEVERERQLECLSIAEATEDKTWKQNVKRYMEKNSS